MAYESLSYDIKERMPEWWKEDTLLEPINRYSQELIRDIIGGLLSNFGVAQPFHVWKTMPTEYSWTHTYRSYDERLRTPQNGLSALFLNPNQPVRAYLPNSKRNTHGVIQLQLRGDQQGIDKNLEKLSIKNANQTIVFNNIRTTTDIKIFTEDNTILIDGVERPDLVKGNFNKIYSQAKNPNYNEVDIDDENKITYLEIESDVGVNFELQIKMIHPVFVVEQNIKLQTLSAFPIEWVKLYGFYCHDFNNKQEWRFLWEKHYKKEERVVFDRITKQFDCETFYVQIKLYGIGLPFVYGFPQEELASNPAFAINRKLDKWGKIYGLPRRYYKTRIMEDEEAYTYPPFYNYSIEQDYWYEERLTSEYRHTLNPTNSALIKDSELNNIAILQCIDPSIHDIYVYTETIKRDINNKRQTDEIYPTALSEEGEGVTWQNPHEIKNSNTTAAELTLKPKGDETFNTKENQTKLLQIHFNEIPPLPKNINIKGIELQLHGLTDIHSSSLTLDDRSQMLLPTFYTKANGEVFRSIDNIQINNEIQYWEKGKGVYKIGGPTNLFNVSEIKRNQLKDGITFNLGFTNLNTFLKATIVLYAIKLIIYYEIIYDSYEIDVNLNRKEIVLNDPDKQYIDMTIDFENTGEIPIVDKNVYIAVAEGLDITNKVFPAFDLDVGEKFTIGKLSRDQIRITPHNYQYLSLIKNSVITKEEEIEDRISFYYKMNNQSTLEIYINDTLVDTIQKNSSSWLKYTYMLTKNQLDPDDPEYMLDGPVQLKVKVIETNEGNVFIKYPDQWTVDESVSTSTQAKTGLYDIIIFCDENSIKEEIIIREGLECS